MVATAVWGWLAVFAGSAAAADQPGVSREPQSRGSFQSPPRHASPRFSSPDDCFSAGRTRLSGTFGTVEPLTAEATTQGIRIMTMGGANDSVRVRLLRYSDVHRIDLRQRGNGAHGYKVGSLIGGLAGVVIIVATHGPKGDFGDMVYPIGVAIGTLPFSVAGGLMGAYIERDADGWKRCWPP